MGAKYALAAIASFYLIFALTRISRDGALTAQTRAWLTIAAIFAAITAWLWWR